MSLLAFIVSMALPAGSGWMLARLFLRRSSALLLFSLALPVGILLNALLTYLYTFAHISLLPLTLWGGHLAIIIALLLVSSFRFATSPVRPFSYPASNTVSLPRPLSFLCLLLLSTSFLFSAVHTLILPSFQIDSFTNWTMRSRISFEVGAVAFDPIEMRGMAKPQYPFLFHALQITANQGQRQWSDRMGNAVLFLLSVSAFGTLFLLISRLRGRSVSLLFLTLLCGLPLLSIHLTHGYADIHLLEFLLLAAASLLLWNKEGAWQWLALSSLFIITASLTKSEGFLSGFFPWAILVARSAWADPALRKAAVTHLPIALLLSLLPVPLLLLKGFPLTPHETDLALQWRPDAFAALPGALFAGGSLGIAWYVLPLAVTLLLLQSRFTGKSVDRSFLLPLLWAGIVLAEIFVTYLFTPNAAYLINGQSFYRQMLLPLALGMLGCILAYTPSHDRA